MNKFVKYLFVFVVLFLCVFCVQATDTNVSLTISHSYSGSIFLDTSTLFYDSGTYYSDGDISFFVSASDSCTYILSGDISGLSSSGSGFYTNYHTIHYSGSEDNLTFFVVFDKQGEPFVSNFLDVEILESEVTSGGKHINKLSGISRLIGKLSNKNDFQESVSLEIDTGFVEEIDSTSLNCDLTEYDIPDGFDSEWVDAYSYSIDNGLIEDSFCDFLGKDSIIRLEMAEILSKFVSTILNSSYVFTDSQCSNFTDIQYLTTDQKNNIKLICQYGLMGIDAYLEEPGVLFNPNGVVTRAEFGTILSRMIFGTEFESEGDEKRYEGHLKALSYYGVMNNIDTPMMQEKYAWTILMLYRVVNNDLLSLVNSIDSVPSVDIDEESIITKLASGVSNISFISSGEEIDIIGKEEINLSIMDKNLNELGKSQILEEDGENKSIPRFYGWYINVFSVVKNIIENWF